MAKVHVETDWELVFAWLPVFDPDDRMFWLQWVERKRIPNDYASLAEVAPYWNMYRAPAR